MNIILLILNRYDPMGLMCQGAPKDEYESEAREISLLLSKKIESDKLKEGIENIFVRSFGAETVGKYDFTALTNDIMSLK